MDLDKWSLTKWLYFYFKKSIIIIIYYYYNYRKTMVTKEDF